MKVVKQWSDPLDEDGFTNIFELNDGSLVFTSEKRGVHRDEGGDLLDESYKCGLTDPLVQEALEEVDTGVVIQDFDEDLRSTWERCIDTSRGY